jgi:hypothetical protein
MCNSTFYVYADCDGACGRCESSITGTYDDIDSGARQLASAGFVSIICSMRVELLTWGMYVAVYQAPANASHVKTTDCRISVITAKT